MPKLVSVLREAGWLPKTPTSWRIHTSGNMDAETCFGPAEANSGWQKRQQVGASIIERKEAMRWI
jgi:hypothetical protein